MRGEGCEGCDNEDEDVPGGSGRIISAASLEDVMMRNHST